MPDKTNYTSTLDVEMNKPNEETLSAMLEAEQIINDTNVKKYNNVEEVLRELKQ